MPFANLSADPDDEYFCDGLTEELLHALTQIEGLKVPSRTITFALKGSDVELRELGGRLGVASILEGSVRRAGDRLRITAKLVSVADGFYLWSETYDRELEDVFAIQDEISRKIVDSLQIRVGPGERAALRAVRSRSAEAYDYYLRGQGYFRQQIREKVELSRVMFERAIEVDPDYAPAWAGLAVYYASAYVNFDSSRANLEGAIEASRKAVELSPGLAEAHVARGFALTAEGRYDEGEAEFEEAIRLDPRLANAHHRYGMMKARAGDMAEAAAHYERAVELAPDDYALQSILPQVYRSLGREDDERRAYERLLASVERHLALDPEDLSAVLWQALSLVALDERELGLEKAEQVLDQAEANDALLLYNVACVFARAGEIERALAGLEKSFEAGLADPEWMRHDSDLDPVRGHPRFIELLERIEASGAP